MDTESTGRRVAWRWHAAQELAAYGIARIVRDVAADRHFERKETRVSLLGVGVSALNMRTALATIDGWIRRPSKSVASAALLIITALAVALRVYRLESKALWFDEAVIYHISRLNLLDLLAANAASNSAPPLFVLALRILKPLGEGEVALRLLPLAAGALAVPSIYRLARRHLGETAGLFAALVLAISPTQIQYSQQLREYSMSVLLAILMVDCVGKWLEKASTRRTACVVLVNALGVLTQYGLALLGIALALLMLSMTLAKRDRRSSVLSWIVIQCAFAITVGLVYWVSLRHQFVPGGLGATTYLASGYWAGGSVLSALRFVYHGMTDLAEYSFPGDAFAFLVLAGAGLLIGTRKGRSLGPILGLPVLLAAVAGLLRIYPFQGFRQNLFLTPLFYLAASASFARLARPGSLSVMAAAALVMLLRNGNGPLLAYYESEGMSVAGELVGVVARRASSEDLIYVCDPSDPVIRYYVRVHAAELDEKRLIGRSLGASPGDYLLQAEALMKENETVWFLLDQSCGDIAPFVEYLSARHSLELIEVGPSASLFRAH